MDSKIFAVVVAVLFLAGCSTIATRGKVTQKDGKNIYTPEEYVKIKGIGEAEFPGGYKIKGKPMLELPPIRSDQ